MVHRCYSKITPFLAGMLLLSTASAPAVDSTFTSFTKLVKNIPTCKGAAAAAFLVIFGRMVYNAEKEEGTEAIKRDFGWLKNNTKKALSPSYVKRIGSLLWNIVDKGLIGSPGKKRGIKAFGTKLVMDGDSDLIGTETGPNGEKIYLTRYNDKHPYGLLGTLWGVYIYPVIGNLKELGELTKFTNDLNSWAGAN